MSCPFFQQGVFMRKVIFVTVAIWPIAFALGQGLAPEASPPSNSTPATASDVEALRQQVQALTETVKTLQQQVKDQQAALDKGNGSEGPAPENQAPATETSPTPGEKATPQFPTEDASVVASTPASETKNSPPVDENG